jgi:hypothetical protein
MITSRKLIASHSGCDSTLCLFILVYCSPLLKSQQKSPRYGSVLDFECLEGVSDVLLYSGFREGDPLGYLGIGQPLGH